jgi:hypothetical protein
VSAALTEDGRTLTEAVVNPGEDAEEVRLDDKAVALSGQGTRRTLSGPDPTSVNQPASRPRWP